MIVADSGRDVSGVSDGIEESDATNARPHVWARFGRYAILAVSFAAFAAALFALRSMLAATPYSAVANAFLSVAPASLAAALALTCASFAALSLYDLNALAALGAPKRWRDIAPGALASYAVAQTACFGPLTGAAVRLRFYLPLGVEPGQVARIVALVTVSFGLGLLFVAALGAFWAGPALAAALGTRAATAETAATAGIGVVVAAFAFAGGRAARRFGLVAPRAFLLRQLAATSIDVACAGGALWALLPAGAVSFQAFLPIYAVALALGILSHVPAGLGVLEATILAALHGAAPTADLMAGLALYRLIYHGAPLALAVVGIAGAELRRVRVSGPAAAALEAAAALAPQSLAALGVLLGAMLVFSGVTPAAGPDLAALGRVFPLPLLESAHFLASCLGLVLIAASRGLAFRLSAAWWAALVATAVAAACSLVKAVAIYEAAGLAFFGLALLATRRKFDRPSELARFRLSGPWLLATGTVLVAAIGLLAFAYDYSEFGADSLVRFEIAAEAPRGLRALVGAVAVAALASAWSLMRPARARDDGPPCAEDIARALAIADAQPAVCAKLVATGDKRVLFSEDGSSFVMYGRQGGSCIALFDPVGPVEVWPELIWSFVEAARADGLRPAFYEVEADRLALYADAGLRLFKLGEEARIDLGSFNLVGSARAGHRNVLSRGAREGLVLDILTPDRVRSEMDALRAVSDEWLAGRRGGEKGFSLGRFDPEWVALGRVATLRREGAIVAFASLLETNAHEGAAVDLMRFSEEAPRVAMEYLFLRLCETLRDEGISWFSLGMAPLAGLQTSEAAPIWQQVGGAVFEHGLHSYNFKGLRGFKDGFRPVWRPRYLAVAPSANPALVLLDAARLVNARRETA